MNIQKEIQNQIPVFTNTNFTLWQKVIYFYTFYSCLGKKLRYN